MNGKQAKKQRNLMLNGIKQHKSQLSKGKRVNWLIITLLMFSVISLTVFGLSKDSQSNKKISAIEQNTDSSIKTYHTSIDDEEVTPEAWRSISLEMHKDDGSVTKIDLLRPLWWIEKSNAKVGGIIELSMQEMGIEGEARVLNIGQCKVDSRKADPKYRVVTGKFTHQNAIILDLTFNNDQNNTLGVTPKHPLWSQTRNSWVEAGNLQIGEYLKTKDGIAQLTARNQRPGRHKVYNLEVHKDHMYYVSNLGILAHNSSAALTKIDNPVDITGFRRQHILNRHRHGTNLPDKTEFPSNWSDDRIIHNVSDVATDPKSTYGVEKIGKSGWEQPYAIGVRDGVEIRVDFYPSNSKHAGNISTAYPLNAPRNP